MCDDEISTIDSDNQERLSICVGHSVGLEKEFIIMNAKEKIEYALTLYHILKYLIVLILTNASNVKTKLLRQSNLRTTLVAKI